MKIVKSLNGCLVKSVQAPRAAHLFNSFNQFNSFNSFTFAFPC